jgi:hypothetical protein
VMGPWPIFYVISRLSFCFLHLPIHAQNTHDTQLHEYPHRKRRHMNNMRNLPMIGMDIMKDNDRTYSWMIWYVLRSDTTTSQQHTTRPSWLGFYAPLITIATCTSPRDLYYNH